jgi:membrane fusion protein, multidrug efflux system
MKLLLRLLLVVTILLGGAYGAGRLIASRSVAKRVTRARKPPLVEAVLVRPARGPLMVVASGTIVAARRVTLQPELSGRLVEVDPRLQVGGRFREGEVLARIEARSFELSVVERASQLARAELDLAVEMGRKEVAEREWEMLQEGEATAERPSALTLREPQVASARAAVAAAQSALERARLDVARTTLRAPFNLIVASEQAELGQLVTSQSRIAELIGTDRFYARVSLPVSSLSRISLPQAGRPGSEAEVVQRLGAGRDIRRRGRVERLLGELEPAGRLARVLVSIDAPLEPRGVTDGGAEDVAGLPLLLGAFVESSIHGRGFEGALEIPRAALEQGRSVWRLSADQRLELVTPEIAWRRPDSVLVTGGLEAGDLVLTTRLKGATPGMKVRVEQPMGAVEAASGGDRDD